MVWDDIRSYPGLDSSKELNKSQAGLPALIVLYAAGMSQWAQGFPSVRAEGSQRLAEVGEGASEARPGKWKKYDLDASGKLG